MNDLSTQASKRTGALRACLVAVAALCALGWLEWTLRRPSELAWSDVVAVWAAVGGLHAAVALTAAGAMQLHEKWRGRTSVALGAAFGALLPAWSFARFGGEIEFVVFSAAGITFGFVIDSVVRRFPGRPFERLVLATSALVALFSIATGGTSVEWRDRPSVAGSKRPSVLLVTLDTTRADRIGVYGYSDAKTPTLDALAANGAWFSNAQTHSVWTRPSHATILTGLMPHEHGALTNRDHVNDGARSMADYFREAGYETSAFVSGFPLVSGPGFFGQSFDHYDDRFNGRIVPKLLGSTLGQGLDRFRARPREDWRRSAEETGKRAIAWLAREPAGPFFMWLHYYDPHLPYEQPTISGPTDGRWYTLDANKQLEVATSPESMEHMSALYDSQLSYTDEWLGRTIERARIASEGNLWIIVTADHGESFDEHGLNFARDSYEVSGRVPLIIVPPEGAEFRKGPRDELVGLVDIAPTLLQGAGIGRPKGLAGVDLSGDIPERTLFRRFVPESALFSASVSARSGRYHLIEREYGREGRFLIDRDRELYDLERDPDELNNLAGSGLAVETRLLQSIGQSGLSDPAAGGDQPELSDAEEEALRTLGYIK